MVTNRAATALLNSNPSAAWSLKSIEWCITRSISIGDHKFEGVRVERYPGVQTPGIAITTVPEPEAVGGVGEAIKMSGLDAEELSSLSPDGINSASVEGTSWIPEVDGQSVGTNGDTTGSFVEAEDICCAIAGVGGMVVEGPAGVLAFLG